MKLDAIEAEWEKDSEISLSSLIDTQRNIPRLHGKYYQILHVEKKTLYKLEAERIKLEFILEEFYAKRLTPDELDFYGLEPPDKTVLKPDVKRYVNSNKDLIEQNLKISLQNMKIEFLKSILSEISRMNFAIKNIIEAQKLRFGDL